MSKTPWHYLWCFLLLGVALCESFTLVSKECWPLGHARHLAATEGDECEVVSLAFHHSAIRTRNITLAIQFYSLLGFEPSTKFRAGPARAAWLEPRHFQQQQQGRLELIEVPSYMLNEPEGTKRRAIDLMKQAELLGHNHLALDVTSSIQCLGLKSLQEWMNHLNQRSIAVFGKTLRIAVPPRQQLIGNTVYELAFLYDADGSLVELLHKQKELPQTISSGWDPLDGPTPTLEW